MDVKQIVDGAMTNPASAARYVFFAILLIGVIAALYRAGPRFWRVVHDIFLTNWQLALLGSAAIVLSLAGGWTTWDGMTNFTGEPVLSLMFTFGIHGVMLIVAWLIGESFATGMSTVPRAGMSRITAPLIVVVGLGVVLLAIATVLYQWHHGIAADLWIQILAVAGLVLGALGLYAVSAKSDVVAPYTQALRIIAKNSMLWVMFLACMATSVFFSFDSRFNVVFPKEQRERVSELRAQKEVSGIVADISATIASQQTEQAEALFKSDGWQAYDAQLDSLAQAAQGATAAIEAYLNEQIEVRNRGIKEQQERITTAQSGVAGLAGKKTALADEMVRLEQDRSTLAAEHAQMKTELDTRARGIDAKRVEAMAEGKGVEGTLKEGRGPVYRQRMDELNKLQAAYKIQEDRVKDAKKRLDATDSRIAQIRHELASIDGDLARYKGEQATAEQRIQMTETAVAGEESGRVNAGRALPAFEAARSEFRQEPTPERLAGLQQRCSQLLSAMLSAEVARDKTASIDCDPKQASEAAAAVFTLRAGEQTFAANCAGGDKLAPHKTTDSLFAFAVKCLSDSGLPSQQTDELRTKISYAEMNRDDKAHRFVVTWNAFLDGNRLAYLALAIAIGIDSLIFMTGLFGANAVRSPLADVPSHKGRNSQQLDAIIENALLPDTLETARQTIHAMRPITNASGFMAEVRPELLDPHTAQRVLGVLNAGATISAVEYDEAADRYLVRAELFEFLSIVAKRSFDADKANVDLAELERIVGVSLLPDINQNAETVLHYMHPITEKHGFTAEIKLKEVTPEHLRTVRNTLNAGATLERVQRAGDDPMHYFIHRDMYKTLARIRARTLMVDYGARRLAGPRRGPVDGGAAQTEQLPQITHQSGRKAQVETGEAARALKADFVGDLLGALRLKVDAYERLSGPSLGAAVAASESFARARRGNKQLDEQLTERDERARMALDRSYSLLKGKLKAQDSRDSQALNDAYTEIEQNWPVLMLLPGAPYETIVDEIVESLEADAGAGRLSTEDQALYEIARALGHAFKGNGRTSETSWRRLEASFNQAPRGGGPRIAMDDGRTLN